MNTDTMIRKTKRDASRVLVGLAVWVMLMWGGSVLPGNRGVRTSAPPKVICRDVNTIQLVVICYVHHCLCVVTLLLF